MIASLVFMTPVTGTSQENQPLNDDPFTDQKQSKKISENGRKGDMVIYPSTFGT